MKWMSNVSVLMSVLMSVLTLLMLSPAALYAEEAVGTPEAEAKPAEDPWLHKINLDHPALSDSAYVMERDHAQVEMGAGFSQAKGGDLRGSFDVLARFDIVEYVEARFEIPGLTYNPDGFNSFRMDSFEAGAKVGGKLSDSFAFAAMPYVILPTSSSGQLDQLSGGLGLLGDLYLTDAFDLTVALYPRLMNYRQADNRPNFEENDDLSFELDGALVASFHIGHRLSFFAEGWFTYILDTDVLPVPARSFQPAASGGAVFYVTPGTAFDLTIGGRDLGDTNTVFGTLGFSVRVL
jgi:hypothetical protein